MNKKPYKLYLGDCLKVLQKIPDESVDLVFADPPYNLSNDGFTCHAGKMVLVNKGHWDKSKGLEQDYDFHYAWLSACKRVLKKEGTLWVSGTYHSIYSCGFALQSLGFHILNDICWFKPNASPNLSCRFFTASHETLIWVRKNKVAKHIFNYQEMKNFDGTNDLIKAEGKQMRSVWSIPCTPPSEKTFGKHPTQKPIRLLERVVLSSSNEGDVVLDPFCGSGTTGVVSAMYNRQFIGIDQDKDYIELSKNRIDSILKINKMKAA